MDLYLQSNHLRGVTDLLKDPDGHDREEVDIEQFKLAFSHVDSQMKSLPATAQVYICLSSTGWDMHISCRFMTFCYISK